MRNVLTIRNERLTILEDVEWPVDSSRQGVTCYCKRNAGGNTHYKLHYLPFSFFDFQEIKRWQFECSYVNFYRVIQFIV